MSLGRKASVVTVGNITSAAVGFVGLIILSRTAHPATLGVYFLFEAVLGVTALGADFGVSGAVEKRLSEGADAGSVLTTSFLLKSMLFLPVIGAIFLAGPYLEAYFGTDLRLPLSLALLARQADRFMMYALRGQFRMRAYSVVGVFRTSTWAIVGITGVVAGFGVDGLIGAVIVSESLVGAVGLWLVDGSVARPTSAQLRSLWRFATRNAITSGSSYVFNWIDTAILGLFVGAPLVAAYELAWRVTKLGSIAVMSISTATFPQISEWAHSGEFDRIGSVVSGALLAGLACVLPIAVGSLLFAEDVLRLVYGPTYLVASTALVVLLFGRLFWTLQLFFDHSLHALDVPELALRGMVTAAAVDLLLNVMLVPRFGLPGAAVATGVAFVVSSVINWRYLREKISLDTRLQDLGWCGIAAVLMLLVEFGLTRRFPVRSLPWLGFYILLGALLYSGAVLVRGRLRTDLLEAVGYG